MSNPLKKSMEDNNTHNTNNIINKKNDYDNITELNNYIQKTLSNEFTDSVKVCGELSNYKINKNSLYASLKDNDSSINIIFFGFGYKYNTELFKNGDMVKVTGKISLYTKSSSCNIMLTKIELINEQGINFMQYEQLKQKYNNLGYFNNKKQLPTTISNIGIITALEGAALQDILYVLKNNDFKGQIVVKNALVQGDKSSNSISTSIKELVNWKDEKNKRLDIIMVTRGGGSFEDLSSFSTSEVIEALHECDIYTISAVGHEIDFMLSDFVSDYRAPTPSIGAEYLCKLNRESYDKINNMKSFIDYMNHLIKEDLKDTLKLLDDYKNKLINPLDKLNSEQDMINKLYDTINIKIKNELDKIGTTIVTLSKNLSKYDIGNHLDNGYAAVIKGNSLINNLSGIKEGQKLKIKMKNGEAVVIVESIQNAN